MPCLKFSCNRNSHHVPLDVDLGRRRSHAGITCTFGYLKRQRKVAPTMGGCLYSFWWLSRAKCDVKNRILNIERPGLCTSTFSDARLQPRAGDVRRLVFPSCCANASRTWYHFIQLLLCLVLCLPSSFHATEDLFSSAGDAPIAESKPTPDSAGTPHRRHFLMLFPHVSTSSNRIDEASLETAFLIQLRRILEMTSSGGAVDRTQPGGY